MRILGDLSAVVDFSGQRFAARSNGGPMSVGNWAFVVRRWGGFSEAFTG